MLSNEDIVEAFRAAGVSAGDVLVVQSSYKGTGGVEGGIDGLIHALLDAVGEEGTLIMPAYNFSAWTEGHYFDLLETPSTVGAVTEAFRTWPGTQRSEHPIHSVSVRGPLAAELCEMSYSSSFGEDSVFARLLELDAMYSTLGLGLEMPFLPCHYTEELEGAGYRRQKLFGGVYVDRDRRPSMRTYTLNVRKDRDRQAPIFATHVMQAEDGVVKTLHIGPAQVNYSRARPYHESLRALMAHHPEMFE